MARLDWNAHGQRFYETGVDRGVLYVNGLGYAWPGLVSVAESPSGGEARPYYLDGIKYLNLAKAEEFVATLTAFYSPPEFGPCDGVASIQNGLFATQQRRKQFDFSYRTKIGNDADGEDHGYKVHLVYNALAEPTERTYQSQSDSIEPIEFSWGITTRPPKLTGRRPTAHFIIDSRSTPELILSSIEDIIYGSETLSARMPSVEELMDVFTGLLPLLLVEIEPGVWQIEITETATGSAVMGAVQPEYEGSTILWLNTSQGNYATPNLVTGG